MDELVIKVGIALVQNMVQLVVGTLIAALIYTLLHKKVQHFKSSIGRDMILILVASLLGALLPLETYGVLPIFFVFLQMGIRPYIILPLLLSNTLFNMLIPFNDPTFVWRIGYDRLVLAIVLAALVGLIIKVMTSKKEIFMLNKLGVELKNPIHTKTVFNRIHNNISTVGMYMIVGVILNTLFNEYVINNVTEAVFSHSNTAVITRFLGMYNIVHPLFLLGVSIIYALMNFTTLSGLLVVIKPKSTLMYYLYCGICALILGGSIFLK